ncbi:MAG: carboxymuconolactone decarboxylase family protein [Actinophytocola sp.]|uniref:carboxymuconolactone decarboxylase family protein n=1 Tax=Actinophytocola sp. TaxID=1872138 RepID=UPI003C738CCF
MAHSEQYERGLRHLRQAFPDIEERLSDVIPHGELGRRTVEWIYADLHGRPQLGFRDRELVTITVLTTLGGCEDLLADHVELGRKAGLSAEEILEAILQCAAYAGIPRAIQASRRAVRTLHDQGA